MGVAYAGALESILEGVCGRSEPFTAIFLEKVYSRLVQRDSYGSGIKSQHVGVCGWSK